MSPNAALTIGTVVGVHGVRGALKVRLVDTGSDALAPGRAVQLSGEGEDEGRGRTFTVARVSPVPGSDRVRLWLEEITTRDDADALRGAALMVDRGHLPPLEEDEYYLADLIGVQVAEQRGPVRHLLGEIVGVTTNGEQDLLEVQWQRATGAAATWLLPAIPEYIAKIDDEGVLVDLPRDFLPTELARDNG